MRRCATYAEQGTHRPKNSARTGRKHCRVSQGVGHAPTLRASIDLPSDKLSGHAFRADVAAVTNEICTTDIRYCCRTSPRIWRGPYVTGTFSFVICVARSEIDSKRSASTLQLSNFPSVGESSMASEPIRDTDYQPVQVNSQDRQLLINNIVGVGKLGGELRPPIAIQR